MLDSVYTKSCALEEGFDFVGIIPARSYPEAERRYRDWLSLGCNSQMGYLERNIDKRFSPQLLMPDSCSIIVCGISYKSRYSGGYTTDSECKVASYALNRDYHTTIKQMLNSLAQRLKSAAPEMTYRAFTDSAPLAEKLLAVEAGLGWIGRQSLLINPDYGSFVHLGELLVSEEFDSYDKPLEGVGCGSCRACVESCPTGAILDNRTIDARRCIACRTIEPCEAESSNVDLNGWIFGCEECQAACPHNRVKPNAKNPNFHPIIDISELDSDSWLGMSGEEFSLKFGSTPLLRAGLSRIQQSVKAGLKEGDK